MASKKGTAKAETKKTAKDSATVEEIDVKKEDSVNAGEDVAKEETKEENTSVDVETSKETASEAAKSDSEAKTAEAPREKRKYTKRASTKTANGKADEKASSKKAKKDAKKVEKIEEVYIEFGSGNKISSEEITDRIKEAYKNEGHRISSIKKLQVYMNIDERKAYYVINDKGEGKYVEF